MKNKNGFAPIALLLLVALALLGGYAYYQSAPASPDALLSESVKKLSGITSLRFSGESSGRGATTFSLSTASGASKASSASQTTAAFSGGIDLARVAFDATVALSVKGAVPSELGFELRKVGDTLYFNVSKAPKALAFLTGQWINVSLEDAGKQYGQEGAAAELQSLDRARLKEVFTKASEYQVVQIVEELPEETVGGAETRHFIFTFDKQALEKLVKELSDNPLDADEEARLRESLAKIDLYENEVWVGKRDLLPYKLSMRPAPGAAAKNLASSTILLSAYNEPVEVSAPAASKTLEEALRAALQSAFPSAKVQLR